MANAASAAPGQTTPVVIPPKRSARATSLHPESAGNTRKPTTKSGTLRRAPSTNSVHRPLPSSIASVLESTAIPVPRRNWAARDSRKLPQGNHVEDFSRLLMEGVKSKEDQLLQGSGNSPLDILLTPPEDTEKPATRNDYESESQSFSTYSLSTESISSLEHDLGTPSDVLSSSPFGQRSSPERPGRRPSYSEDCAFDHPLLDTLGVPDPDTTGQDATWSKVNPSKSLSFPRLGSTFKSNLTASLRAIKSAAQTVSAFATPAVQPDDFLTRSLFSPELTDDRRPPPMNEPPSPALRRYLNPVPVSPAEMHTYHEHPHEPTETSQKCPVSMEMQTYRRRSRKKSTSHFSAADTDLPYHPEIHPMARQREPRENGDFLRMVVLEMNMRRSGKLRDDIPTRARIWLPPRKNASQRLISLDEYGDDVNGIPSRWLGRSIECM